jgi:transaldolase
MKPTFLRTMTRTTPTIFWNDSCVVGELENAVANGATGATSNPPLVLKAVQQESGKWNPVLLDIIRQGNHRSERDIAWALIRRIVGEASGVLLRLYQDSKGEQGLLSVQVDPTQYQNADAMINQAIHVATFAPNLSIKIPVTAAGLVAIEELASRGINTTATVSFTVPQVLHIERAYQRGLKRLRPGAKEPFCFAVLMAGRLDDHLKDVAKEKGLSIDAAVIEKAGIADVKKSCQLFEKMHAKSIILVGGMRGLYHITDFVGGRLILTISPAYQQDICAQDPPVRQVMDQPVSRDMLTELEKTIPDFGRAYAEDGMTPTEFEHFGSNVKTQGQFIKAFLGLLDYVKTMRASGEGRKE